MHTLTRSIAILIGLLYFGLGTPECLPQSVAEMKETVLKTSGRPRGASHKKELTSRLAAMLEPALRAGPEAGITADPRKALLELSPVLKSDDFSPGAKEEIARLFKAMPTKEHILLAGLADVTDANREITQMAEAPIQEPAAGRFYGTRAWAACLVKARGGEQAKIQKLVQACQQADPHTQVTVLLDELAFVPRPEIVSFLGRFLFSEARLEPVKENVPGQRHADFAAAALARMLENFPAEYKEDRSYSDQEIQSCRAWLAAQSSWKFRCHAED